MTLDEECPFCDGPMPDVIDWIQCDSCLVWYHLHCINLQDSSNILKYYCSNCDDNVIYKRTSKRRKAEINYKNLNDGEFPLKSTKDLIHPYIKLFNELKLPENVINLKGDELTLQYALKSKLLKPIKIENRNRKNLGLYVPEFELDELRNDLGSDYELEVMNVLNQENIRMTVGEWVDYFQSEKRDQILNVLSLEISHCKIGQDIKRPNFVNEVDLVDKVWPSNESKPKVTKYCLMGIKDSYTDFHLDFAGTSVYYTILKGKKQFILYPPTKTNLNKYYKWIIGNNELAESNFLPNFGLEQGIKLEINKGDLLIIPSGWIHGVWTLEDTVVIGGNFLTCFNIDTQLKIIELEIKTKVDKKFKFPKFNKLMVLTALQILNDDNIKIGKDINLENCVKLYEFLVEIFKIEEYKSLTGDKDEFLDKFKTFIQQDNDITKETKEMII